MIKENYTADRELFDAASGVLPIAVTARGLAIEIAKFRADSVILGAIKPLESKKKEKTKTRDRFIKSNLFITSSKEETEIAVRSLRGKISDISRWAEPAKQKASIQERYEQAVGYYQEAEGSLGVLNQAFAIEGDSAERVEAGLIKTNPQILRRMVDFYFNYQMLDQYKWKDADENDREMISDYFAHASDPALEQYVGHQIASERARIHFWNNEVRNANLMGVVREMVGDPRGNIKALTSPIRAQVLKYDYER